MCNDCCAGLAGSVRKRPMLLRLRIQQVHSPSISSKSHIIIHHVTSSACARFCTLTRETRRSSNAATAWQELLQHLVWSILAAAGLPASDAPDGAHTQVMLCHHRLPSAPLQTHVHTSRATPNQPDAGAARLRRHIPGRLLEPPIRPHVLCSCPQMQRFADAKHCAKSFLFSQLVARPPADCSGYGG